MTNFVADNGDLPAPKTDDTALPAFKRDINYVTASDWNITRQAILDIKSFLHGANSYGLAPQASDPAPAGVTDYIWLKNDGTLWITISGVATQVGAGVPTTRTISAGTGLTGGGDLTANRTLALANTAVTPGTYTSANLTLDQQGRVTAASNGGGGAGAGAGSLAISVGTFPGSTTNLSTVGTFDWYWPGSGGVSVPVPSWSNQSSINFHWKKGGSLYRSVVWFGAGASSAPSTFPGTTTFTSTASDDSYAAALSATDGSYFIVSGSAGFQVNVPASPTSRTLRIYCGAKGVTVTIAASLEDGSVAPATATFNAATGVNVQQAVDVVFQGGSSTQLRVTVTATAFNGGVQAVELWGLAEF